MSFGFASSEFWLHVVALIAPAILQAFQGSGDPVLMVVAQLGACVYTAARTILKHQDAQAIATAPVASVISIAKE